mmetsp:Transcript_9572/g.22549  ORF Transcript_9572/g.22549 Transcript_9572/m.22549 type:complete len:217 (-) Transcript_9572:1166-1816(-)
MASLACSRTTSAISVSSTAKPWFMLYRVIETTSCVAWTFPSAESSSIRMQHATVPIEKGYSSSHSGDCVRRAALKSMSALRRTVPSGIWPEYRSMSFRYGVMVKSVSPDWVTSLYLRMHLGSRTVKRAMLSAPKVPPSATTLASWTLVMAGLTANTASRPGSDTMPSELVSTSRKMESHTVSLRTAQPASGPVVDSVILPSARAASSFSTWVVSGH